LGLRWRRAVILVVTRAIKPLTLGGRHVLRRRVVDMSLLLLHLHRCLVLRMLWKVVLRWRMGEELLLLLWRLRGLLVRVWCGHGLRLGNIGLRVTSGWLIRVMLRLLLLLLLVAPVIILRSIAVVGIKSALLCRRTGWLGCCPLLIKGAYTRRLLDVRLPLLRGGGPVRRVIGLVWLRRGWSRGQRRLV
jgi:hypothetical protein